jgi:hypothetical protein
MLRYTLVKELLSIYVAAGVAFCVEEYLLSFGSHWSSLPPIAFAVLFVGLLIRSKSAGAFALVATPALLVAEKQFLLIVFMILPYFFSSKPSI